MNAITSTSYDSVETYKEIREKYLITNWNTRNVSELEELVNEIKELGDKSSIEENELLSCKLGKLEHEATRLYEELEAKKSRQRSTRIKIAIGIGITAVTLLQPYFIEEIKHAGDGAYGKAKNYIESIKSNGDSK